MAFPDDMDPDLREALEETGATELDAVRAKGREHWLDHFAALDGFARDFDGLLEGYGVSWEDAPSHDALQGEIFDYEIGAPASYVIQKAGIATMADVFRRPRAEWRDAMARRNGLFAELESALGVGADERW